MSLVPLKNLRQREQPRLSWWPQILVVSYAKTARFPSRTFVGISCRTSFPSASYMMGLASGFTLHTLRRMVVLPAFALPMMRIRNWGHSARIASALRAPCLTGRSLDGWASLFADAIAGEDEECTVRMKIRWSEINQGDHDQRAIASFSGWRLGAVYHPQPSSKMFAKRKPRDLPSRWPRKHPIYHNFGRPLVWTYSKKQARDLRETTTGNQRTCWGFTISHLPLLIANTNPITSTPLSFCTYLSFYVAWFSFTDL